MRHKCIFAVVPRGKGFDVLKHASSLGLFASSFYARSLKNLPLKGVLGQICHTLQEIVLLVCPENTVEQVIQEISLLVPQDSFVFSLDIEQGINSLLAQRIASL